MKISIIIPIYNAEKYLSKAIESCINQTLKEVEVILVNDGSIDNSFNICKEYKINSENIKLIDKKNEGVSIARNTGLEYASGEFIMFLDADDWLDSDTCEIMYNKMIYNEAEMVFCNYIMEYENQEKNNSIKFGAEKEKIIDNEIKSKIILPLIEDEDKKSIHTKSAFRGPWAKLFRKDIIDKNNIRFNKNLVIGEDFIFNLEYLKHSKKVIMEEKCLYHYRINNESALNRYREDFWNIYRNLLLNLEEYLESNLSSLEYLPRLNKLKLKYLLICVKNEMNKLNRKSLSERREYIKKICDDDIIRFVLKSDSKEAANIKDKLILFLLRNNMISVVSLYSILKI